MWISAEYKCYRCRSWSRSHTHNMQISGPPAFPSFLLTLDKLNFVLLVEFILLIVDFEINISNMKQKLLNL